MKLTLLFTAVAFTQAFAQDSDAWDQYHFSTWSPPGPSDVRAPCPMLNTLANHGFLPHSGKNISEIDTINALSTALNINQTLGEFLFQAALTTNPEPNATTFSLDNLDRHDILEHDASLSRGDFYFGDDHTFNQTIFDETRSYWTAPIIDVQMAANARLARVHTSNATNPTFGFTQLGQEFSFGESAAYILVLGDRVSGTVPRSWVEYLFENERLPLEVGWTRRKEVITFPNLIDLLERVVNATGIPLQELKRRGDFHAGL
ncbi:heme-thiolate peroxidase [Cudoniella acicularis]|uniref:Heme-thiolate peroxidase n=1 Tax=Cudoniella acicularis TaxID=354080 RepID=A0A8H4R9Z2_9HELO|nr:heme-thiolate peroxidase [Cudoniella acicularis]